MRVITWNVNSIRTRFERLLGLLERHQPELLCLQETKVTDELFPHAELAAAGWQAETHGQKTYNGVALITRTGTRLEAVVRGIPGDPVPEQARAIAADLGGMRFLNLYVVNGQAVGSEKYAIKLRWLDALIAWLHEQHDPSRPMVLLGDFNIAPRDEDVHDPVAWKDQVLCSEPERERLRALEAWGLSDLFRLHHQGPDLHTWWDYRGGAFARGHGLRIDLALGTPEAAARCKAVSIDREERKQGQWESKPSDHAPVLVEFGPSRKLAQSGGAALS